MLKHMKNSTLFLREGNLNQIKMLLPTSPVSNILYFQEREGTGNLIVEMRVGIIPMEEKLAVINKNYVFIYFIT